MNNTGKHSVLIVDDEKLNLDVLVRILSPEYTIYVSKSGASAVEMAHHHMPDIILLDILMPDMDGYEVLGVLKKSEKTRNIPVIFITGLGSIEDEEKGLDLDAADYIHKPFSAKIVRARVRNQIKIISQIRAEEQSKFFAKMSHEMRTPLNAVIGLSDMTLETGGLSDEAMENVEKISNAGASLLGLVNDILDISKIEAGKFELLPVEYDIAEMIYDAITQSIVRKGEKPIDFVLNIDESIPKRLFGDDMRIKQIFKNLLSNAFKYTKEGTVELNIKAIQKGETIWLITAVKDTGIGIKADNLGGLFADYSQMDLSTNRTIGGTGLGLSITKMMVDLMGGSISVESEYGKGSVFTAELPQKIITTEKIGPDVVKKLKHFRYQPKRKSRLMRISLPYARVLIVDDVITNLDVAKGIMKPYKMIIDCVTSGQQAIDAVREEKVKYNAIFMDHMMPVIDGIEATRIIREEIGTEYAKTVPIIAFTANVLVGNEEMFLNKGFQAFISKPINIVRLDAIIRQYIRDEELEKTLTSQQVIIGGEVVFDSRTGYDRRSSRGDRRKGANKLLYTANIKGVDINKGIERFGGSSDVFQEVLKSFTINTRTLLETIENINSPDYAVTVHGIKGSCRGIYAEEMGNRAEALEKAAKAGNTDFVKVNNQPFIEAVLELIAEIETIFHDEPSDKNKPKKDKPDMDLLLKLSEACKGYKIDEIEKIVKELECYEYESDDGLVSWLRENTDYMNYMEITGRLTFILQNN